MKTVGVLGSGQVGEVLANGFLKYGYGVMRASRDVSKLEKWRATAGLNAKTGDFAQASQFGQTIVLAVKGNAAEALAETVGRTNWAGKTVLDATNPIADVPPVNGVLQFFTGPNESLMERIQKKAPEARVVKAFSCVGNAWMVNPDFGGTKPTMFVCGNHSVAKEEAQGILTQFGWDTEDLGKVEAARAIEPLCMLWCIPGFTQNKWTHAFKLLRK